MFAPPLGQAQYQSSGSCRSGTRSRTGSYCVSDEGYYYAQQCRCRSTRRWGSGGSSYSSYGRRLELDDVDDADEPPQFMDVDTEAVAAATHRALQSSGRRRSGGSSSRRRASSYSSYSSSRRRSTSTYYSGLGGHTSRRRRSSNDAVAGAVVVAYAASRFGGSSNSRRRSHRATNRYECWEVDRVPCEYGCTNGYCAMPPALAVCGTAWEDNGTATAPQMAGVCPGINTDMTAPDAWTSWYTIMSSAAA